MKSFSDVFAAFFGACGKLNADSITLEEWKAAFKTFMAAGDDTLRIYPCAHPGCTVKRTKAEGGTIFTVCDKHWDEAHPPEKPEHAKTCQELIPFICCACGEECCTKHGLKLESPSKWKSDPKTRGVRRCTPCADAGR